MSGERFIREKHTLLFWALPKGPREKSVKGGEALYPGSVSEFHCTNNQRTTHGKRFKYVDLMTSI